MRGLKLAWGASGPASSLPAFWLREWRPGLRTPKLCGSGMPRRRAPRKLNPSLLKGRRAPNAGVLPTERELRTPRTTSFPVPAFKVTPKPIILRITY